jgi:hypothetical protein
MYTGGRLKNEAVHNRLPAARYPSEVLLFWNDFTRAQSTAVTIRNSLFPPSIRAAVGAYSKPGLWGPYHRNVG